MCQRRERPGLRNFWLMELTRRRLLGLGLGGFAVAGMLTGVGMALQRPRVGVVPDDLDTFSASEYGILAAIAEALCPGGEALPTASDLDVASLVDATVARMHRSDQDEFKLALWLMESAVVGGLLDGSFHGLTHLSLADRTAALEAWRTSGLTVRRTAFRAVSGLVMAAYWSHPKTWQHVGYAGPPVWMKRAGGVTNGG